MNVLMASYGLRPAGDPWSTLIGAASAAAATATAEYRRQQPLEAQRAFNDLMAAYAQNASQGRVADAEAQRLLAVAAARLAVEQAAAQGHGGTAPSPSPSTPPAFPAPPSSSPPSSTAATGALSVGAKVGLAAAGVAALAGITYVAVKAARKR